MFSKWHASITPARRWLPTVQPPTRRWLPTVQPPTRRWLPTVQPPTMPGYGSSGIRTSRSKRRVGCRHGNTPTGMDCRGGHSSRRSLRIVPPPNDRPGVDLRTGCLCGTRTKVPLEQSVQIEEKVNRRGFYRDLLSDPEFLSRWLPANTSFREAQLG
jgi:hypothetical protein